MNGKGFKIMMAGSRDLSRVGFVSWSYGSTMKITIPAYYSALSFKIYFILLSFLLNNFLISFGEK